jgi:hypothetical protein
MVGEGLAMTSGLGKNRVDHVVLSKYKDFGKTEL